jgi:hypothetical protein
MSTRWQRERISCNKSTDCHRQKSGTNNEGLPHESILRNSARSITIWPAFIGKTMSSFQPGYVLSTIRGMPSGPMHRMVAKIKDPPHYVAMPQRQQSSRAVIAWFQARQCDDRCSLRRRLQATDAGIRTTAAPYAAARSQAQVDVGTSTAAVALISTTRLPFLRPSSLRSRPSSPVPRDCSSRQPGRKFRTHCALSALLPEASGASVQAWSSGAGLTVPRTR